MNQIQFQFDDSARRGFDETNRSARNLSTTVGEVGRRGSQGLRQLNRSLNNTQASFRDINRSSRSAFIGTQREIRGLAQELLRAGINARDAEQHLRDMGITGRRYIQLVRREMERLNREMQRAESRSERIQRGFNNASRGVNDLARGLNDLNQAAGNDGSLIPTSIRDRIARSRGELTTGQRALAGTLGTASNLAGATVVGSILGLGAALIQATPAVRNFRRNLRGTGSAFARMITNFGRLNPNVRAATEDLGFFRRSLRRAGNILFGQPTGRNDFGRQAGVRETFRSNARTAAITAGLLGAARGPLGLFLGGGTAFIAGAGIARATRELGRFEDTLRFVQATLRGTDTDYRELTEAVTELGSVTRFTNADIAAGALELAFAGRNLTDIIETLPSITNFALAARTQIPVATQIATSVAGQFGLVGDELQRVFDVFVRVGQQSRPTALQLGAAFEQTGTNAAQFGQTVEQITAALGTLGNIGLVGAPAGTALNAFLRDSVRLTNNAQEALLEYGLTTNDVSLATNDLLTVVSRLAEAGVTADAVFNIFTSESARAVNGLIANVRAFNDLVVSANNATGATEEVSRTLSQGLPESLAQAGSASESFRLQFARTFSPQISGIVDSYTSAIRGLTRVLEIFEDSSSDISTFNAETQRTATILQESNEAFFGGQAGTGANPISLLINLLTTDTEDFTQAVQSNTQAIREQHNELGVAQQALANYQAAIPTPPADARGDELTLGAPRRTRVVFGDLPNAPSGEIQGPPAPFGPYIDTPEARSEINRRALARSEAAFQRSQRETPVADNDNQRSEFAQRIVDDLTTGLQGVSSVMRRWLGQEGPTLGEALAESFTNAFINSVDRLLSQFSERLVDAVSQAFSGGSDETSAGGFQGFFRSLFGDLPQAQTGFSGIIRGRPNDRSIISIDGVPSLRVSGGEGLTVTPANQIANSNVPRASNTNINIVVDTAGQDLTQPNVERNANLIAAKTAQEVGQVMERQRQLSGRAA